MLGLKRVRVGGLSLSRKLGYEYSNTQMWLGIKNLMGNLHDVAALNKPRALICTLGM
jgi:hypothetical protein